MERYEVRECIYTSPENGVWVHRAVDRQTNQSVILKYVQVKDAASIDILRKEGDNQLRLNKHPNICKIYDFFPYTYYSTDPPILYLVLSLEECPQDLDKLWTSRSLSKNFVEENDLWRLLNECVEALAYAQDFVSSKQDICHRDIKPPNILLGQDGRVRICDFGSSKYIQKANPGNSYALQDPPQLLTLQGTPQFLSPKQRGALQEFLDTQHLPKVNHNPYKSDVYSLGYTFLVVSLLEYPVLRGLQENGQQAICAQVQKLNYSDQYKQTINWMMTIEEQSRPDFLQLRTFFRSLFPPTIGSPDNPLPSCIIHPWHHCSLDLANPSVVLTCNPAHVICSTQCFREFVFTSTQFYALEVEAVICPVCKSPVSPELIYQAYGNKSDFELERVRLRAICGCGSENYVRKRFECYHRYCRDCWRRHGRPHFCPECRAPVIPKEKKCEVF